MTADKTTIVRRNAAILPWLRAAAFAGTTFLALRATGFYPVAVPPLAGLAAGALSIFSPGLAVLVFLLAAALPLLAADIIVGAVFLVLGLSAIQYLSEDGGRAFVVVALAFAATLVHAEWAIAALAGYVLGASDGAIVAFVACLVVESAGLVLGRGHIGVLATGGTRSLVDTAALAKLAATTNTLAFGWLAPSLGRIDIGRAISVVTGMRDVLAFVVQPFAWAIGATLAGLIRRPVAHKARTPVAFAAVAAGVAAAGGLSFAAVAAFGARVTPASLGVAGAVSLGVGMAGVALSEFVFTPSRKASAPSPSTSADDADVDELLRMISSAEEELTSKHTTTRTVLITDMKAFSRMTQELGSAETAKLVQRHRDLLLPIVEKHGGRGKSTGGDGLLAAFERPGEAIAAAAEMQQALAAYNAKRQGETPVLIRAGAAIGEVVLDKGGKPFLGDALNLAARIMSLADGGQVFTSRTVLERADAGSLQTVSHGTFRLKNIAAPVEVVEVLWSADQTARAPQPPEED